jgi:hypothetical protein
MTCDVGVMSPEEVAEAVLREIRLPAPDRQGSQG